MGRLIDMRGRRFNRLVVLDRGKTKKRTTTGTIVYWLCKCDCGNVIEVVGGDLRNGKTQSCGCYQANASKQYHTKHGLYFTRLHVIWDGMKNRCYNNEHHSYHRYGGRGINVCYEWQEFLPFYEWAMANGYADNLTIDRVDNDGNYCPENCRWSTIKEQANNNSRNVKISFNGETHTISEWSDICGITYSALHSRFSRGWSVDKALTTPTRRNVDGHYVV